MVSLGFTLCHLISLGLIWHHWISLAFTGIHFVGIFGIITMSKLGTLD